MTNIAYQGNDPSPKRHSVGTVGLWIFLAALAMLFASSMFAYVYIRIAGPPNMSGQSVNVLENSGLRVFGKNLSLLWVSTFVVLGVSLTIHMALAAIRRERRDAFRSWLWASFVLSLAFVAVQTPAMVLLLKGHNAVRAGGFHVYGLIFFLVLLHALHVVGGVVALVRVMVHERQGTYDHEHNLPVRHAAMYWHFLDVVWLVMFGIFLLVG
jgi:heme/copper-type cytochrome/quinol oxidase subunit 3